MKLNSVKYGWSVVDANGKVLGIWTTRKEAREYRASLKGQYRIGRSRLRLDKAEIVE